MKHSRPGRMLRRIGSAVTAAFFIGASIPSFTAAAADGTTTGTVRYTESAWQQWVSYDWSRAVWQLSLPDARLNGQPVGETGTVLIREKSMLSFTVSVKETGTYFLAAVYRIPDAQTLNPQMKLTADGTETVVTVPALWADASADYEKDRSGSDMVPDQVAVEEFAANALEDYASPSRSALTFSWESGEHALTLTADVQEVELKALYLLPAETVPDEQSYRASQPEGDEADALITIEGERYAVKSNSYLNGRDVSNPGLSPYDTYEKRINVLGGSSWKQAGEKVLWEFNVKKSGYYRLGFRYSQTGSSGKASYRSIEIDGATPFSEWEDAAFPPTSYNEFKNLTLTDEDGSPQLVWLEAGHHTIALRAEIGPMEDVYNDLMALIDDVNSLGMQLQKLAAGQTDNTRTWDMDSYMPNAVPDMKSFIERIGALYEQLRENTGKKPVYADSLLYAVSKLKTLLEDPRTIPNQAESLHSGDDSVVKNLSQAVNAIASQSLSLDCLYLYGGQELPKAGVSFFFRMADWVKKLAYSFTRDYGKSASGETSGEEELQVWINRPLQYTQVLQQLIDRDFNPANNTNIRLSIMNNEQKLILSNASGVNPDVVLGVSYYTPFDFAIRGAAKNLLDYPGFLSFYNSEYNLEALVPLSYGEGVYGAVETQDFRVLFYRQDILDMLGLSAPNTWDDVKRMMPILLRNGMNFGLPLAMAGGFKSYNETSPYIYQESGQFYAENGASVAIQEKSAMNGFTEMTDIFNIYGAQSVIANFYNSFRFMEIPIGIGTFGTYVQLQNAAPELAGKWGIALAPGTRLDDGTILRYQAADGSACMIFKNTDQAELAGKFLMWWLSKDVQKTYAYTLKSNFGDEYSWNTANLEAFSQLDYPENDKALILEQWKAQKETIRHPANYMVEREVSNIWNNVVVNNDQLADSVDQAAIRSNREILRKLEEFGYCDSEGNLVKNYVTDVLDGLEARLREEEK